MQPVDQQQWTPPPAAPVRAEPRARTWLIVLTAFLVELVVIAAACNQGLSNDVQRYYFKHQHDFVGQLARSTQVYAWRYSSSHSYKHAVLSQYLLLLTLFVLTGVLVFALARGAVTFGRVFLGTWLAVIVATQLGSIVQLCVVDLHPPEFGKLTWAVFSGPSGFSFMAGFGLGLLTAVIAAVVAVSTRRSPAPAAPERFDTPSGGMAAAPEPWVERDRGQDNFATAQFPAYSPPAAPPSAPAPPPPAAESAPPSAPPPPPPPTVPASAPASDATTQIPRMPPPAEDPNKAVAPPPADGPNKTVAPPPADDPNKTVAPPPADDPNKTTMLPRPNFPKPPDDEDLGHQPE